MKGHYDSGGGWKTVGNRRSDPVTLFVSNIPEGAKTDGLRKIFLPFGKIVDIYMEKKKDSSGANFAFIRFSGVHDGKVFEKSIGVVKFGNCILNCNLARYQRKTGNGVEWKRRNIPVNRPQPQSHHQNFAPQYKATSGGVKGRSYANVMSGRSNTAPVKTRITVPLVTSRDFENSLRNMILVGELIDFDKLKNLLMLLDDEGIPDVKVCYYGGLYAMLRFNRSSNAIGFMKNVACWKKWFTWLENGLDSMDVKFKRLAWLRIDGLPLHYRITENINKIVQGFGEVVEMNDRLWDSSNLSNFKAVILTSTKTRINEEITITNGGKDFQIGVSETYYDCHPFSARHSAYSFIQKPTIPGELDDESDLNGSLLNSDDDDDDDDGGDGISETWEENQADNEIEIGELPPDNHIPNEAVGGGDMTGDVADSGKNAAINDSNDDSDNTVVEESCTTPVVDKVGVSNIPHDINLQGPTIPNIPCFNFGPFPSIVPIGPQDMELNFNPSSAPIGPFPPNIPFSFGKAQSEVGFRSESKKPRRFSPVRPGIKVGPGVANPNPGSSVPVLDHPIDLNKTVSRSDSAGISSSSNDDSQTSDPNSFRAKHL